MAKQTINVGQAANDGSGDPLRNAFIKANDNFTELYDSIDVQDLDFQGDSGSGSIELDSQVLDIAGGTGLGTVASGQTLTINIDSSVVTLSGSQTLTNKTIDVDSNTVSNIEVDNLKSGVLDVDLTSVSASDDTIASAKAIKTYVDSQVTAQDLDFTGNSGTGGVDLDSQTLNLIGANGVVTTASGQTITIDTSSLDTRLTTAEANISSNDTDIATNASNISTNATNIASNDTDISGLDTRLTTAEGNISSNDTDIATNATNIATNASDITAIETKTDFITVTQAVNLDTMESGISTNASNIATNTSNISTNTSNIATNVTNIATNATNISSNDTDITALQNDKYDKTGGTISGSVTISNDLTVNGTTTTVNTETLSVEDPLIEMANQNAANSVDTGFYAKYSLDSGVTTKYAGLFKDASDSDTFKLFKGLEVEPTTTINTGGTGYALADLDIAALSASSGSISGDLVVDTNTLYVDSANNRVSVGTTNAQQKLHVQDAGAVSIRLNDSTTNYWDLTNDSNLIFSRGGTERMRIDLSGNVGINETNPSTAKLVIETGAGSGIDLYRSATNANFEAFRFRDSTNANTEASIGWSGDQLRLNSTNNTVFTTGGTERMRITSGGDISFRDTSANEAFYWDASAASLGIGTTSARSILETNGTISINDSRTSITTGDTLTGIDIYTSDFSYNPPSGRLSMPINRILPVVEHSDGDAFGMAFYTAAKDADSVERMRIDSSGVTKFIPTKAYGDTSSSVKIGGTFTGTNYSDGSHFNLVFGDDDATNSYMGSITVEQLNASASTASEMRFYTNAGGGNGGINPNMVIDSSGNVGIGTDNPNFLLTLNAPTGGALQWQYNGGNYLRIEADSGGGSYYAAAGLYHRFFTSGAERMRVTSGGEILFGGITSIPNGTSTYGVGFASITSNVQPLHFASSTTSAKALIIFKNPNGTVGDIRTSGSATAYNTSGSDLRLKKNIEDWNENVLDSFASIQPKEFHFNVQDDNEEKVKGYIAHDNVDKFPEAYPQKVYGFYSYNPSGMVVYLMKAIQELKAEIENLKSQIQ
jgi:hypothetical protein